MSQDAIINFHNNPSFDYENPHATVESGFQQEFLVFACARFFGDHPIGPHFVSSQLSRVTNRQFLEETLPGLLEDVPLQVRRNIRLMHDGAPARYSLTREYLVVVSLTNG